MSEQELVAQGLTPTKAQALRAVYALSERLALPEAGERPRIRAADDAVALLRPFMAHLDHEEFGFLSSIRRTMWLPISCCTRVRSIVRL